MLTFKEGDKVRVKEGYTPSNYFPGEAIFRGDSTTKSDCVALERLDRGEGNAQNGWWNFRKSDLDKLELVIPNSITPTDEQNKSAGKIMRLTAKIKRIFNKKLQLQYKAGLIDDRGSLTSLGREEVDMLLRDLVEEKLTERAKEIIAEDK